jgi:hypothetical protein
LLQDRGIIERIEIHAKVKNCQQEERRNKEAVGERQAPKIGMEIKGGSGIERLGNAQSQQKKQYNIFGLKTSQLEIGEGRQRSKQANYCQRLPMVRALGLNHMLSTRQGETGLASSDSTALATRCGVSDIMHPFQLQAANVLPS